MAQRIAGCLADDLGGDVDHLVRNRSHVGAHFHLSNHPVRLGQLVNQAGELVAEISIMPDGRLEVEDETPQFGYGGVEPLDPFLHVVAVAVVLDSGGEPLQGEPDGEEILDDGVMEIAGNPFAVFHHGQPAKLLLEPDAGDCGAGNRGERLDHLLVLLGEPSRLLGQVQIAEDPVARPDRDPEERSHRWMVGRETARVGVVLDTVEANGLRFDDECSQHPATGGQWSDGFGQIVGDPDVDEFHQGPVLPDHPERRVLCAGDLPRGLGRRGEQLGQVAGGGYGGCTAYQSREPLGGYFGQTDQSTCTSFACIVHIGEAPLRILLVDDHEIVRKGLRSLLDAETDLDVVGEAASAEEALRRVGFDSPDVVVLDVRLPDRSGIEACRDIRSAFPDVKVLMLTSFADEEALMSAILAGASGYLLKRIDSAALLDGLRRVGQGESLIDQEMVSKLFSALRGGDRVADPLLAKLSDQERKVLDLIAEGMTNREIAEQMFLSEKTVKNYVSNLLTKLGMSRRSEAAAYAARATAPKVETDRQAWD